MSTLHRKSRFAVMVALVVMLAFGGVLPVLAQAPSLISYQGRVTEIGGESVAGKTTIVPMEFSIWNDSVATGDGNRIWGPLTTQVPVVDGVFNAFLGNDDSGRSITVAFHQGSSGNRYLSASVGGVELEDRQQILSTPYALSVPASGVTGQIERGQISNTAVSTAQIANGAVTRAKLASTERVPVGTVVAYFGTSAPAGWLLCNGAAIPSGNAYNELRNLIGNNTPDLRGMFLRGTGRNSNSSYRYSGDNSRAVGTFQMDELREHSHRGFGSGVDGPLSPRPAIVPRNHPLGIHVYSNLRAYDISSAFEAYGGEETRPKNAAVTWIIKY